MELPTARTRGDKSGRTFHNHANERLRILGEIPVRKFDKDGKQPLDPDGNPDTSFLAKVPADVAFTFQTLDRHGMVLSMAQTWHQVRPGEVRNNCGGCHAHSQEPTPFEKRWLRPRLQAVRPDEEDASADGGGEGRIRPEVRREGRDRPAARGVGEERGVPPRHQADPPAELRRLPQRQVGRGDGNARP